MWVALQVAPGDQEEAEHATGHGHDGSAIPEAMAGGRPEWKAASIRF
jgi:hypothetical protein